MAKSVRDSLVGALVSLRAAATGVQAVDDTYGQDQRLRDASDGIDSALRSLSGLIQTELKKGNQDG